MFDSVNTETTGASSNLFGEVVGAIGKTIKIQIARNALLAELSLLAEVVEPKGLMPSLNYMRPRRNCRGQVADLVVFALTKLRRQRWKLPSTTC
jgi:hypothetical protein